MDQSKKIQEFEELVRSKPQGMSRRDFLRHGMALGLSIPATSGIVATFLGAPTEMSAKLYAPKYQEKGGQGTLVVEQAGDPISFNPDYTIDDNLYSGPAFNIFSMLVCLSQEYEVIPDLAESWEVSEDGLQITFNLVQNAVWHDGTPVTSADIKWTYEKIVGTEGAPGRDNLIALDHIETPDEYTAIFVLSTPSSQFLGFLAWYATFVLPAHIYDGTDWETNPANQTPVGSGPFKFVEYVAADHITLEANLDYYGEGPYMDRIVYRIIPDPGTLEQALLNDEIDYDAWGLVAANSIPAFEADDRFTVVNKVFPSVYYITFNFGREITGNIAVREAIGKAIDRDQIVERGLSGSGSPVDTYYTPVIAWANNEEATAPAYDVEGAKALLEEAGYPVQDDGYRFTLVFPYFAFGDSWRNLAQVIQAQLREIEIDTELVELEAAAWTTRVAENDDYDISMLDGFFGPGPGNLRNRYGTGGGINYWHYSNEEVDQLLVEGEQAVGQEAQAEKYHAIQAILAEEIASIPLSAFAGNYIFRSDLSGVPLPGDEAGARVGFGNLTLVQRAQ
jgi:peptide/nickel transport system substrate-binding protein